MTTENDMKAMHAGCEEERKNAELRSMADRIIENCISGLREMAARGCKGSKAELLKRGLSERE